MYLTPHLDHEPESFSVAVVDGAIAGYLTRRARRPGTSDQDVVTPSDDILTTDGDDLEILDG